MRRAKERERETVEKEKEAAQERSDTILLFVTRLQYFDKLTFSSCGSFFYLITLLLF